MEHNASPDILDWVKVWQEQQLIFYSGVVCPVAG
jgi:hypothetical protein